MKNSSASATLQFSPWSRCQRGRDDKLQPSSKGDGTLVFAYDGLGKTVTLEHAYLDCASRLNLGVFEWSVELWKGVHLENTLDFYRTMSLRNQLARGSAWGFFVTALPEITSDSSGGRLPSMSVKANLLNAVTKVRREHTDRPFPPAYSFESRMRA